MPLSSSPWCEKEGHVFGAQFGNPQQLWAAVFCARCGETRLLQWKPPDSPAIVRVKDVRPN